MKNAQQYFELENSKWKMVFFQNANGFWFEKIYAKKNGINSRQYLTETLAGHTEQTIAATAVNFLNRGFCLAESMVTSAALAQILQGAE